MLLLRLVGIFALISIGVSLALYVVTREPAPGLANFPGHAGLCAVTDGVLRRGAPVAGGVRLD
mgnify:CR=1 FL=1